VTSRSPAARDDSPELVGDDAPQDRVRRTYSARLVPIGAVLLAVAAIVAAYLTSLRSSPAEPGIAEPTSRSGAGIYASVSLSGAYPLEDGPDGIGWQWIGESARLTVTGSKASWLEFRAISLRIPRVLTFVTTGGTRFSARIGLKPRLELVGPLPQGSYGLLATPPSTSASPRDSRHLSIALSLLRTVRGPVAALPGAGFWPTETYAGTSFNWLRDGGVIDLYAPRSQSAFVWLAFTARSAGEPRSLTAVTSGSSQRVDVSTDPSTIRLGPFRLTHGRARVTMQVSPGPRTYGTDPRGLSLQVANIEAQTAQAGTTG